MLYLLDKIEIHMNMGDDVRIITRGCDSTSLYRYVTTKLVNLHFRAIGKMIEYSKLLYKID